jgi:hypothetical protein
MQAMAGQMEALKSQVPGGKLMSHLVGIPTPEGTRPRAHLAAELSTRPPLLAPLSCRCRGPATRSPKSTPSKCPQYGSPQHLPSAQHLTADLMPAAGTRTATTACVCPRVSPPVPDIINRNSPVCWACVVCACCATPSPHRRGAVRADPAAGRSRLALCLWRLCIGWLGAGEPVAALVLLAASST